MHKINKSLNGELFKQIYDSNVIGFFFENLQGQIFEANDAFLEMIGYTREELKQGKINWIQMTPPEYLNLSKKAVNELKDQGHCSTFEKEYFHKNGSRVSLLMGAVRIQNHGNYQALVYVLNISDKKNAEKALAKVNEDLESRVENRTSELQQMNSFLDSLIEHIPNMIFVKDAKDLKFVRFNKAGEKLLGIPKKDLIGKSDYDFFPKPQADFFTDKDRDVLCGKEIVEIQEESIATHKGEKILRTKKIPLLDSSGKPQYLLGISEDITQVKIREEERLHLIQEQVARVEAEKTIKRLTFLSETSTVLASSLDVEVILKRLSRFMIDNVCDWCSIQIAPQDQSLVKLKNLIISHKDEAKAKQALAFREKYELLDQSQYGPMYAYKTQQSVLISEISDEILHSVTDSKDFFNFMKEQNLISAITVPIKQNDQVFGTITLTTSQESGRCFNQADLKLFEELSIKISLALDNARLYGEAQKANRIKDEFLATLSHELRTPLNVIQGYSSLLKNNRTNLSPQDVYEYTDAIYRNAQIQGDIINDLLDVSKIVIGKMKVQPNLFSPSSIIETVLKGVELTAREKNVFIQSDMKDCPQWLLADETRFQQIVLNLISNAVKFTPPKGAITIKAYKQNNHFNFEVQDTGMGIDPEFLPHLFERFSQEDSSMKRKYEGLGLGLSIAKYFAEAHGGSIKAESEGKGKGSLFMLRLPLPLLSSEQIEQNLKKAPLTVASIKKEMQLRDIQIVLVEDSVDTKALISKILTMQGAMVHGTSSAKEARQVLKTVNPHLIISDIGMPEEDGTEFIRKLRASKINTPAIALTAYAREEEKEYFLKSGFHAHISKPISVPHFVGHILKVLKQYAG